MLEIIVKGGITMVPLLLGSVLALAIILERLWALRASRVTPKHLVAQVWNWHKKNELDSARIRSLRDASPLGEILAAGLVNHAHGREIMKESIEETGRHVVMRLERFLNTLGTIASISPLLGLLGTVFGMIDIFTVITAQGGNQNIASLAGGIAEALITTATGLIIAIPTFIFYRHFQRRVDELVSAMEQEALKMVEVFHGEREMTPTKSVARKAE